MDGRWKNYSGRWLKSVDVDANAAGQTGWLDIPGGTLVESMYMVVTTSATTTGTLVVPGWFASGEVGATAGAYTSGTAGQYYATLTRLQLQAGAAHDGSAFLAAHVVDVGN